MIGGHDRWKDNLVIFGIAVKPRPRMRLRVFLIIDEDRPRIRLLLPTGCSLDNLASRSPKE
jgi:hypothetical protein